MPVVGQVVRWAKNSGCFGHKLDARFETKLSRLLLCGWLPSLVILYRLIIFHLLFMYELYDELAKFGFTACPRNSKFHANRGCPRVLH